MNLKELQSSLELQYQSSDLLGINFACTFPEGKSYSIAAGFSDLERTIPLQPDRYFPIFSISKTYLATLTLLLQEQGARSLVSSNSKCIDDLDRAPAAPHERIARIYKPSFL